MPFDKIQLVLAIFRESCLVQYCPSQPRGLEPGKGTDNLRASDNCKVCEHIGYLEVNLSAPGHFQIVLLEMGPQGSKPSVAIFLSGFFSEN